MRPKAGDSKKTAPTLTKPLQPGCVPDGSVFMMPILGPTHTAGFDRYCRRRRQQSGLSVNAQRRQLQRQNQRSYTAVDAIASRERSLDLLDDLEKNSVDFYTTVRSAYMQNPAKPLRQLRGTAKTTAKPAMTLILKSKTKTNFNFYGDRSDEEKYFWRFNFLSDADGIFRPRPR